jgi:adenylate cyclase class 2
MSKNIEIELKLPLLNSHEVENLLSKIADFKYQSFQHDIYYNAPHRNFLENSDNINEWLRIRITDGGAQINYKDWQPHDDKIKTHCKEFEANIDSYDQLSKILDALNFIKLIDVNKTRKAWIYLDTEISIDSVDELGEFIELEYKGNIKDITLARKHLFNVLEKIKAKTKELDTRGYPYSLLKKKGLLV